MLDQKKYHFDILLNFKKKYELSSSFNFKCQYLINYPNFDVLVWQVFIVRVGLNHTRARSIVYNSEEARTIVLCRLS